MTGPTSEAKSGSEPKISLAALDEALHLLGRLDVLHGPAAHAGVVEFLAEAHHALERTPGGAHALDRRDLVARA